MKTERIYKILFSSVYPLYIQKVEKKGRPKEELDIVIKWLTGYNDEGEPLFTLTELGKQFKEFEYLFSDYDLKN